MPIVRLIWMGLWVLYLAIGFVGVLLVLYGTVAEYTGEKWGPAERLASFVSAFVTLLGAIVTAASIYLYAPSPRPPWQGSRYFLAPPVIAASLVALVFLFRVGILPNTVISGFALIALAGALIRLVPYPMEP